MGTPEFAVPPLRKLINSQEHEVIATFTGAPKAKDRGMKVKPSPVHELANESKIPVYTPKSLKAPEIVESIKNISPDVIVVCAYGVIIPGSILEIPRYGAINIHPSLLPRHRGAAPMQRTITEGDKKTGVCIMQMDESMDTGDILMREEFELPPRISLDKLHDKCANLGGELLVKTLNNLDNITPWQQSEEGITYAKKVTKNEGRINWQQTAGEIDCNLRGMKPWPGCYCYWGEKMIKIISAVPVEHNNSAGKGAPVGKPGEVISLNPLQIACAGSSALEIEKLQLAGKRAMTPSEFLLGHSLQLGEILN